MRSVFTIGLALLATTAALVHCSASGSDDNGATGSETEAGTTEASTDAPPSTDGDADLDAGRADAEITGHCSPDHWCREALPTPDFDLEAVWSFAPNDAIAVGTSGMIHWDGKTWSLVPGSDAGLETLTRLWASGPNELWGVAQGQHSLVRGTRAAGADFVWTTYETDGGPTRELVAGAAQGDVWTAGVQSDGTPVLEHGVTADGGAPTFTTVPVPDNPFSLNALFVSAIGEPWLTANNGDAVVLHAQKSGSDYAWDVSLTTAGKPYDYFSALWGIAPDEIWVLGGKTDNYHRSPLPDGGGAWGPIANHTTVTLNSIWGSGKNDVYAVGYFGAVRHWDGTTWSVSQIAVNGTPIYKVLQSVHGSSANDVWAVGPGVALHRTTGGTP
jgi:hypothetical protein